jgi:hypothetical protein
MWNRSSVGSNQVTVLVPRPKKVRVNVASISRWVFSFLDNYVFIERKVNRSED